MPHLITIIKYARNIVKYILVLMSALLEETNSFVWRTVQVVLFVWIGARNGFVWYSVTWSLRVWPGQAGGLSYFEV